MIVELKKNVYSVGVVDWELRQFHGHELSTHRGSSYNSYLIVDEKTVLVDTVWEPFKDRLIANIAEVVDPASLDIVVVNHSEPDHSGGLPEVMRRAPDALVVVSKRGRNSVPGHYHQDWNFHEVGTGDRLGIGENELVFVEAPMLHWPDSMFTYLTGKNILMPNDAFGQHYAAAFRFNDQVNQHDLYEEALKYYANILTPYSSKVRPKIEELLSLNLPVDMIAPSHGIIWRDNPTQIVTEYLEWADQKTEPRAVVLYDTMWHGTGRMAEAIGDGLADVGVQHKILNLAVTDRNDAIADVFESRTVIVGSSTVNNGILPTMAPIMEDLRRLGFKHKLSATFGSYGWSGEAPKIIHQRLEEAEFEMIADPVLCKWQPDVDVLNQCREHGRKLGKITTKGREN